MYPNLLLPLLVLSGALLAGVAYIALRQPVSRRLAFRQLSRRRNEALLAVVGSVLGTAIIAGALVVGDTLNFSVKQEAYRTLGPVDERVLSADAHAGDVVAARLAALRSDSNVDGVLSAHLADGAATMFRASSSTAEPRVLVWGLDLDAAARFGTAGGSSGLAGPTPDVAQVVVNQPLASSLGMHRGDVVSIYLFGQEYRLIVSRIVAERGLAGVGLGSMVNRNAFVAPQLLDGAAAATRTTPRAVTLVSNTGGVEAGATRTTAVTAAIDRTLQGAPNALVETPKRDVLATARTTGDSLGALFLMIGSFSIIAGALLLVNIFVMLADERKSQLGMLRAVGMRRSRLIGSLTLEGSAYAIAAILPGTLLGIGVGWAVARVAAQIFRSFSANGEGLAITFAVTPTSLVNAAALGLVIGIATIVVTSVRISRFNVIGAIRDLPYTATRKARRLLVIAGTLLAALLGLASMPAIAASQAESTYLLPALTMFLLIPLLRGLIGGRAAISVAAGTTLLWSLTAPLARPHLFDHASMAVYVVQGSLLAFSAVALVSQNQDVVLAPMRALFGRPSETGLAVRLAVAYPLAKRFRTGATLVMYALISLVLVLLVEIAGIINASIDRNVADATAGYSMRLDFSAQSANQTVAELRSGRYAKQVGDVTPLVSASAFASDPGHRASTPIRSVAVGVPDGSVSGMAFTKRLDGYPTNSAVWNLIASDSRYVAMDAFFGATGGPNGSYYSPGDTFTLTDPVTGLHETKVIAGILSNALLFYPVAGGNSGNAYPVVASEDSVRQLFGPDAVVSAAFVRTGPGVLPSTLAAQLQATYLEQSLVATPMEASVRRMFAANIAFFRLMQGFLALGLAIGITGLGVVMVRAVRERRRTIGVLRALGFRARTVERSFLVESAIVAVEGVLLGSILGVVTTWLMYQKSATFEGVRIAFPIEWATIAILCAATLVASLAATYAPARRAAAIKPAIAVRVAD